jgi:hypothetical protein
MSSLSILSNLELYEENLQKLAGQQDELKKEYYRLEGAIRLMKNFRDMGIDVIPIPNEKKVLESTEVEA